MESDMRDEDKTKEQIIMELNDLSQRVKEMEIAEAERKKTEKSLHQRNRHLRLLYGAGQVFNSSLDLDQVLHKVLEEMRNLLDVLGCSIWLVDPETDELICHQVADRHNKIVSGWHLAPGVGIAGWVAYHGESLVVPDAQTDTRHFEDIDELVGLECRSILSVPLRARHKVIGVLQVVDTEVERFSPTDLALAEALAATASIAIDNARLYEQAQYEIAQRMEFEQALRENERKFRSLTESTSAGILISQEDKILYVNPAIEKNSGYSRAELLGSNPFNLVHPDFREIVISRNRDRMAGKEVIPRYEFKIIRKDGEERWIDMTVVCFQFESKLTTMSTLFDITEFKLKEDEQSSR